MYTFYIFIKLKSNEIEYTVFRDLHKALLNL